MLAAIGVHGSLTAEQKREVVGAALQATPGVAVGGGASVAGLPLSDWLVVASLGFVFLQAAHLVWKWRRDTRLDAERQRLKSLIEPDCDKR